MDKKTWNHYCRNADDLFDRYNRAENGVAAFFKNAFEPGSTVLDIGCGAGRDVLRLIKHGCDAYKLILPDPLFLSRHLENNELIIFDPVIANPPFSQVKWWDRAEVDIKKSENGKEITPNYTKVVSDPFGRFSYGIPTRSYGDLVFLDLGDFGADKRMHLFSCQLSWWLIFLVIKVPLGLTSFSETAENSPMIKKNTLSVIIYKRNSYES